MFVIIVKVSIQNNSIAFKTYIFANGSDYVDDIVSRVVGEVGHVQYEQGCVEDHIVVLQISLLLLLLLVN